jgi:pimeloyl-ACP methyl ester carboxylesterase
MAFAPLAAGCKSMTPGKLSWIQPDSQAPYAGNVYLIRGWIGIWSYGVDHIGQKINAAGVRASVFQEDQWQAVTDTIIKEYANTPAHEPLILIGHSYGADDVIRMAKRLGENSIPVDLVITLDPVVPPKVPSSIKLCYNIYQPSLLDSLPFFRGIALETETPAAKNLQNVNIRAERRDLLESDTDHFNIEKNGKIHSEIVKKVLEVCPPRQVWTARMRAHDLAGLKATGSGQNRADISAAGRVEPARLGGSDVPAGQGQ